MSKPFVCSTCRLQLRAGEQVARYAGRASARRQISYTPGSRDEQQQSTRYSDPHRNSLPPHASSVAHAESRISRIAGEQQMQSSMSTQASQLFAAWVSPNQQYVAGTPDLNRVGAGLDGALSGSPASAKAPAVNDERKVLTIVKTS